MHLIEFDTEAESYHFACELRNEILRKPLGLDLFAEDLESERDCRHFGVLKENRLIAYLLIVPQSDNVVLLRQMCVEEHSRGQGVGSFLVAGVEQILREAGVNKIQLAARVSAIPFYEALGYDCIGEEYESVGIPHRKMEKQL